ncbi:MAG: bifunctional lysylphosphatidylglycerol flippase/synthetase MprF [Alphaproteobacteria bacterium]|nr:bifunctional lysylphosphatidylglycerol flippase/synthetase MprF [Alphaproteobacteria bacterium]
MTARMPTYRSSIAAAFARWLWAAIPIVIFGVCVFAVRNKLADTSLDAIAVAVSQIGIAPFLGAVVLAGLSYLAMSLQDLLALRTLKIDLPPGRALYIGLVSNAIGQTAGASLLSAGALRWRFYAPLGLSARDAGYVSVFTESSFIFGMAGLLGVALVAAPNSVSHLSIPSSLAMVIGVALLSALLTYPLLASARRAPLRLGPVEAPVPQPRIAVTQVVLGIADTLFAGLALAVLIEPTSAQFLPTMAAFALASAAAAASGIPAGLGSFEAVLLLMAPVTNERVAAALILYRVAYYLVPLATAALTQAVAQRQTAFGAAKRARAMAEIVARNIAPRAAGALVAIAGLVLLLSGATPALEFRMEILRHILPLAVVEMSHLAASLTGFALLLLARGLFQRTAAAWTFTMIALALGATASLAKGLDFEEALVMILAMVVLTLGRDAFHRQSAVFEEPLTPGWLVTVAVFVGASVWLGLFAYSNVQYSRDLWWQFEFEADAPRFLRATLAIAIAAGAVALWRLLKVKRARPHCATPEELARVAPIIAASPAADANLAYLGDKSLLFSEASDAFLMYGVRGRSWIAFSDPVGPPERIGELIWRFREICDLRNVRAVYYQIDSAHLQRYIDLGFSFLKLGEEARVPLAEFDLIGKKWSNLRNSRARAQKEGATFEVISKDCVAAVLPRLQQISNEWLAKKGAREKRFTLGRFDEAYLTRTPCGVLKVNGEIKAFANILQSGHHEEASVDLMRQANDAPQGAMDFLFVELCFWAKAQGFRWFNLGLAPLSGLEARKLAPAWTKIGALVFGHGEQFYNFAGLRRYKEKFNPIWRSKYMASPGGIDAVIALTDASALVSGGYAGMFGK